MLQPPFAEAREQVPVAPIEVVTDGHRIGAIMGSEQHRSRDADAFAVLLERCAEWDSHAFAALYDETSSRVYGLALRVLRDTSHAEEVVQEIFMHVWRSADQFDRDKGSAYSWLFTITHRKAVDRVRQAQSARRRDTGHALRTYDATYDSTSEQAVASVDASHVRDGLSRLSSSDREILYLAYFQGHTHVEIASILHLPLGTAKYRIRTALHQLRDDLVSSGTLRV